MLFELMLLVPDFMQPLKRGKSMAPHTFADFTSEPSDKSLPLRRPSPLIPVIRLTKIWDHALKRV